MTSEQLAEAVEETVRAAKARVTGVGKDQYDQGDTQQFETMTTRELLQWAHEEALDLVVYGVMTAIRIKRVERQLKKGFDL
ncbi:hypothetical protein [Nonomuraea longicatena]|uniref:Uncharacterized protein n=1 Tax=Nonomuraea longicatena TaxID=83682 RepID=A0ABN1RE00_9ACTN